MGATSIPEFVLELHPGTLAATLVGMNVSLFLREEKWGLMKYPPTCAVELRLGSWEIEGVLLVALLARLNRADATTFEAWINVGDPIGVRLFQTLAPQSNVALHLVTDRIARSFQVANPLRSTAAQLVHLLRERRVWTIDQFEYAQRRLTGLYPTASDLWRRCADAAST